MRDIVKTNNIEPGDNLIVQCTPYSEVLKTRLNDSAIITQSKVERLLSSIEEKKHDLEVKSFDLENLKSIYKLALKEVYKTQCKANLAKENEIRADYKLDYAAGFWGLKDYIRYAGMAPSVSILTQIILRNYELPSIALGPIVLGHLTLQYLTLIYCDTFRRKRGNKFFDEIKNEKDEYGYIDKYKKKYPYERPYDFSSISFVDFCVETMRFKHKSLKSNRKESKLAAENALLKFEQYLSHDERRKLSLEAKKEFYQIEKLIRKETIIESKNRLETLHNEMIKKVEIFYESDIGMSIQKLQDQVNDTIKSIAQMQNQITEAQLDIISKQKQAKLGSVRAITSQMTNYVVTAVIQHAQDSLQSLSLYAHQSNDLNSYLQASEELIHGSTQHDANIDFMNESAKNNFNKIINCIEALKKQPSKSALYSILEIISAIDKQDYTPENAQKLLFKIAPTCNLSDVTTYDYEDFVRHLAKTLFASVDDLSLENNNFSETQNMGDFE